MALLAAAWLLKGFPFGKEEKPLLMGVQVGCVVSTAGFLVACKMLLDRECLWCSPGRASGFYSQEKLCHGFMEAAGSPKFPERLSGQKGLHQEKI